MAEALAAASSESGQANPLDSEAAMPAVDENDEAAAQHAQRSSNEQPADADNDGDFIEGADELVELLVDPDNLDSQSESESGIVPGSDEFWNQTVEVNTVDGPQQISVREAADGWLRQDDYTRKTQALAEQRKALNRAEQFLRAFEDNPFEFSRSLAVQAGLVGEGDRPVKDIEIAKIPTQEEINARIEELVEERIQTDPRVQEAQVASARAAVDAEFSRLQTVFKIPIDQRLRDSLIQEAQQKQTGDLEALLAKRLVLAQQKRQGAAARGNASAARPGTPPPSATAADSEQKIEKPSISEAFRMAQVAASQQ